MRSGESWKDGSTCGSESRIRVEAAAAEMLAVSEKHGFAYPIHLAQFFLEWARAELGSAGEGISQIRRGLAGLPEIGGKGPLRRLTHESGGGSGR